MVQGAKYPVFTDPHYWTDWLETFLEDETTYKEVECVILGHFQTLLQGPAVIWWNTELPLTSRLALRKKGLRQVIQLLIDRFQIDPSKAIKKFNHSHLTLRDIHNPPNALGQYILHKLRWARAARTLNDNNSNWFRVIINVYNSFNLDIKYHLHAP